MADKHYPVKIVCRCGETVPWGKFDRHGWEANLKETGDKMAADLSEKLGVLVEFDFTPATKRR